MATPKKPLNLNLQNLKTLSKPNVATVVGGSGGMQGCSSGWLVF